MCAPLRGMRALDDPHTIHLVLKKLPAYVTDRWKRLVDTRVYGATPSYPTFTDFVELVATEARIACGPDQPERKVVTYALLDPQSDASFVTDALCDALHPEATEVELELSTMNGRKILKCMSTSGLVVESLENGEKVDLPTLYSRQEIPADHTLIPRPETCLKWTHLHQVADKIPVPQSDADIGLLLGVNCPRIIKPREVIPGEEDDPWAVRTLLGWGIVGLISKSEPKGCFYVGSGDERKKVPRM
ncbi:hypothetical protein FJT64_021013 [Amphibalanus amphitrite]|uniref:Uncharacterized protein n=1 Tax=Amphibalanus amphitrite TaxID=1232801 RepID=A0A6A4X052_AMPAM|nr:hypothetical protein FJT64_021013 [Amphibalanus amphitrite]